MRTPTSVTGPDGGLDEAGARRILADDPGDGASWNAVGLSAVRAGDLDRAAAAFERAAATDATPRSLVNRALALDKAGHVARALHAYDRVLARFPGHPRAAERRAALAASRQRALADLLKRAGEAKRANDPERTLALLLQARHLDPARADLHRAAGLLLFERGSTGQGQSALRMAIAIDPRSATDHGHLAANALRLDDIDTAERAGRRALALDPSRDDLHALRGQTCLERGSLAESEAFYRTAHALSGGTAETEYALATVRLLRGDLPRGFDGYRARWAAFKAERRLPVPQWDGVRPPEGRLYLWSPEGVGDQVLFASMLEDLRAGGVEVVVECDRRWVPVWRRSFPWATVIAQRPDLAFPDDEPGIVAHYPLALLGCLFRRGMDAFPRDRRSYLRPDEQRTAMLRERYRRLAPGPLIGLSWRSVGRGAGSRKTTNLLDLAPVLRVAGRLNAGLVNLQYGDCRHELDEALSRLGVAIHQDADVDQTQDFDGLCAQVAALDLVVSVSNVTAHVAGAVGTPCRALIPCGRATLWHWFSDRTDSPWYPSLRLFRQDRPGSWDSAVSALAADLSGSHGPGPGHLDVSGP